MTREADFKQKFQKELKKRVKPVAILQYKQDATTIKGFPGISFFCNPWYNDGILC